MPRYFFNVYDGASTGDAEGIELANPGAARQEAIRAAGSMLRDQCDFASDTAWKMIVRDETGTIVTRLTFTAT